MQIPRHENLTAIGDNSTEFQINGAGAAFGTIEARQTQLVFSAFESDFDSLSRGANTETNTETTTEAEKKKSAGASLLPDQGLSD